MKKRNLPKSEKTQRPRREREPIPWRYCFLTLICGVILVGGFFFAARQHFSAIDYGFKNAKLRQQKEDLEADQRRFKLTKEIALSPAEIKKAARKIGFQDMSAANIQLFTKTDSEKPSGAGKTADDVRARIVTKPENSDREKNKETGAGEKSEKKIEKKPEANKPETKSGKTGAPRR